MKRALVLALSSLSVLAVGFLYLAPLGAGSRSANVIEEHVHVNLVRVRLNGQWEDFPLMPLADHVCKSPDRLFEKYCGDALTAPAEEP